jgi:hypothetical protein
MQKIPRFPRPSNLRQAVAWARSVRIEDELKRRGIQPGGNCPRCGSKLRVSVAHQFWSCEFRHGDVIALVQHLEGLGFFEAVSWLTGYVPLPQAGQVELPHEGTS